MLRSTKYHSNLAKRQIDIYKQLLKFVESERDPKGLTPCDEAGWAIVLLFHAALHSIKSAMIALDRWDDRDLDHHSKLFRTLNEKCPELVDIASAYGTLFDQNRAVRYYGIQFSVKKAKELHDLCYSPIAELCEKVISKDA